MAATYYVRSGSEINGPYDVATLKSLVQQGAVTPAHEISTDQIKWNAASRYPKLFPPQAAPSFESVQGTAHAAPAAMQETPATAEAAPQQPLGYYTHKANTDFHNLVLKRRSVIPFAVVAGLMLLMSLFTFLHAVFGDNHARDLSDFSMVIAATCGLLLLAGVAFVLWLVWVSGVHQDMKALTESRYSISPGMAVGFSCIPIFDAFWIVYMPWRMASELNRPLEGRGLNKIPVAAVMTMQILSIPFAILIPGVTVALYAGSMTLIQRGLNRLSASITPV
jgi:hypothetical protein